VLGAPIVVSKLYIRRAFGLSCETKCIHQKKYSSKVFRAKQLRVHSSRKLFGWNNSIAVETIQKFKKAFKNMKKKCTIFYSAILFFKALKAIKLALRGIESDAKPLRKRRNK
jgi:hypothetical protein